MISPAPGEIGKPNSGLVLPGGRTLNRTGAAGVPTLGRGPCYSIWSLTSLSLTKAPSRSNSTIRFAWGPQDPAQYPWRMDPYGALKGLLRTLSAG